MTTIPPSSLHHTNKHLFTTLTIAALAWLVAYNVIQPLANWFSFSALGLARDSRFGESLAFFLYDVPKILLLLSGMVFAISIVRTFFSPERTRSLLGGKRELSVMFSPPCSASSHHFAPVPPCRSLSVLWNRVSRLA